MPDRVASEKPQIRDGSPVRRLSRRTLERRLGRSCMNLLTEAGSRALRHGWNVLLVGGVVRDLLLERPLGDLDLVVEGDARQLARELARAHRVECVEHPTFGTATLRLDEERRIDLATARRESYPRPAALPRVQPATLIEDLRRRDFSINAMALTLAPEPGKLLDPLGGSLDLQRRTVRVLHERSFVDDPTRTLRAIRFAVRLGFDTDRSTARLLRRAARGDLVARLSAARLRRELDALFREARWAQTARRLRHYGLWRAIDRGLCPTAADLRRLDRLESLAGWLATLERAERTPGWVVVLTALTRRWTAKQRDRLVARLLPSRVERSVLQSAADESCRIRLALRDTRSPRPSRVRQACRGSSHTATLLALDAARSGGRRAALRDWLARGRFVRPDIRATHLLRAGVPRGPALALGLDAALDAKLDGEACGTGQQLRTALRAACDPPGNA